MPYVKPPTVNPLLFLTKQERLYLHMRRFGLNRTDVARAHNVCDNQVSAWLNSPVESEDIPDYPIQEPIEWGEILQLARRRRGWSLEGTAKLMGISHVALINRETGNGHVQETIDWWQKMGWPYPSQTYTPYPSETPVLNKNLRANVKHRRKKGRAS